VIADDQATFSAIVARLLRRDYDVLKEGRDGMELLAAIQVHKPDIVVADIQMPVLNGIEAIDRARSSGYLERCECRTTAVVFLTNHDDPMLVERAFAAGGLGYVLKARAALDLLPAIGAARRGRRFVSPPLEDPSGPGADEFANGQESGGVPTL
jgi:DNA-binding NarL/FixJ family response regulator